MLVSAIMPTRGRCEWAQEAVECFLSQTYPEKELVIVDDGEEPSFPDCLKHEQVQYHRLNHRLTIGSKRNLACSRANGDVLMHLDSDDWSAPERMLDQINRLRGKGVGLTGYNRLRFLEVATGEWWLFNGLRHQSLGTTMMYTREFWREHPFPDINEGEDSAVYNRASKVANVDAGDMMWARSHSGNTSKEGHTKKGMCWEKL